MTPAEVALADVHRVPDGRSVIAPPGKTADHNFDKILTAFE